MILKKSLREFKYVAAQMNKYNPLLEEIVYAFQDPRIVQIVGEITGIEELIPDENLYAGGISLMAKGNYLEPHLDNSHDKDRENYRVLNLLYYVTPDWKTGFGGNSSCGIQDRRVNRVKSRASSTVWFSWRPTSARY
jgi:Rps23 Pro-64 3,4-dihydroxylase Tpa1-like proline 4-hydroxylase